MKSNLVINGEELFTTKQIAENLTISKKAVRENAKKCLNKTFENGKPTYFTKAEVTVLIDYIQKHNNRTDLTCTTVVQAISTELTPALRIKQAMDMAIAAYEDELKRIESEKEDLQIKLDESKEWYSIKRMELLNPGREFDWRLLKNESKKLGIELRKAFDQNYGEVNTYHISVWESLFFDTINYE